jgi:hypothetical protein
VQIVDVVKSALVIVEHEVYETVFVVATRF